MPPPRTAPGRFAVRLRQTVVALVLGGVGVGAAAGCADQQPPSGQAPADEAADAANSPSADREDLGLVTFDGERAAIADYRGTPVVVNFWASWCPPCIAEMPDFETVHQAVGDAVAFVGINTQDRPGPASELAAETGVTYDLLRDPDGRAFATFEVRGMPTTLFLDATGEVVGEHVGALNAAALRDRIAEHLSVDA